LGKYGGNRKNNERIQQERFATHHPLLVYVCVRGGSGDVRGVDVWGKRGVYTRERGGAGLQI